MSQEDLHKLLKDPNAHYGDIKNANIQGTHKVYDHEQAENHQLQLIPDENVKTGLFLPIAGKINQYKAHPLTIKAIKKDLFVTDLGFEDYSLELNCSKCDQIYDLQFYRQCPHCP